VLRLWVASQDFRNDIIVSDERIRKVGETYRVLRNALRYQLSNLFDFDPTRHTVPEAQLTGLDRWILGEFAQLGREVAAAYDVFEFHVVYQKISQFAAVELSAVYHDVVKDRLYTDAADSPRRRSTQTTMHRMVSGLCRMLAPILAFTSDEAWELVPGKPSGSVHLATWTPQPSPPVPDEEAAWQNLFAIRDQVLPRLEAARQAKSIGKALEAQVTLRGAPDRINALGRFAEDLREVLNVSQLTLTPGAGTAAPGAEGLEVEVAQAQGRKCERCWHWETDVGSHVGHPTLCGRCVEALKTNASRPL
jgi:isoleucyl-tRNA synthetase